MTTLTPITKKPGLLHRASPSAVQPPQGEGMGERGAAFASNAGTEKMFPSARKRAPTAILPALGLQLAM